ncbi:hypothetical protein [Rhodococcus spongiicola]|uniref:hypothetical protein n=1 Tax=Rhodococcus spongiicola TaxID=2487352 RepID=UPI0013E38243|nr:hypothetical protein [Rhodococcus spongiicola]
MSSSASAAFRMSASIGIGRYRSVWEATGFGLFWMSFAAIQGAPSAGAGEVGL